MSIRCRKIIFLLLVFVIFFLLVLNYLVSEYGLFWRDGKKSLAEPSASLPSLSSPLEGVLFDDSLSTAENSNHLNFTLKNEAPVLAVFGGEVSLVEEGEEFNNIQVKEKSGLVVSYIFTGEIGVKEGDDVFSGQEIGLVDPSQKGIACLGGGNLGVYLMNEDGPVKLSPGMINLE